MDEKNARFIRNLVSPSGEVAGSATRKSAVAKPVDDSPVCSTCGGTGWRDVVVQGEKRVARCGCFLQTQTKHILAASEIPARYAVCEFSNFESGGSDGLAAAKIKVETWATRYPLDRTGLLLVGPSG